MDTAFPSVTAEMIYTFLNLSPDALVVVDSTSTIVLINERMETMSGYRQEELIGKPVEILLPEHLRAIHKAHPTKYFNTPRPLTLPVEFNPVSLRKDGNQFPVDITLRPILIERTLQDGRSNP